MSKRSPFTLKKQNYRKELLEHVISKTHLVFILTEFKIKFLFYSKFIQGLEI